jgi:hypothetical protein
MTFQTRYLHGIRDKITTLWTKCQHGILDKKTPRHFRQNGITTSKQMSSRHSRQNDTTAF